MRRALRSLTGLAWLLLVVAPPALVAAAEWAAVIPGTSTMETVRAQFGAPTRSATHRVEGYDSPSWTYEGAQAPGGVERLTVEFGLLTPAGYRPNVVRLLRLEPKPGVFDRQIVLNGWGEPQRIGKENEAPVYFYQQGLLVYFDRDGGKARVLIFTPPQPSTDVPARRQP
ncbi:MAG: hypothetical protein HY727_22050 [Candidatus Rokubacteria bacterium]|nr:hypothetical protein [Candidatus Rokubacteria bacterium]